MTLHHRNLFSLITVGSALAFLVGCDADPAYVPVDSGENNIRVEPDVGFTQDSGQGGDDAGQATGPSRISVGVSGGTLASENHRLRVGVGAPITSKPVKIRTETFELEVGAGPVIPAPSQGSP